MKSLKLKKIISAAVAALTIAALSPIGASAAWKQNSKGWWNTEGSSYSVGWRSISGSWYYFNSDGYMKTGWVNDGGTWYYLQSSGAMKTGWIYDGGTWYYLQPSGAMKTGWVNDGGIWYYLQPSGAMKTGWINDNGVWYFASASGAMQTGVVEVEGKVYYLAPSGAMATGNVTINGVTYTFDASGSAVGDKIPTTNKVFKGDGSATTPSTSTTDSSTTSSHHSSSGSTSSTLSDLSDGNSHTGDYTISTTGTFGASSSSKVTTINGDISLSDTNALAGDTITLQNLNITGTLTVDFGAGNVILDNVVVNGVNVSNVGSNSLHVRGNSSIVTLNVNDENDDAHIVVEGDASIANTTILAGAQLEVASDATNSNPFANVTISPASATEQVAFRGDFNNAAVEVARPSTVVLATSTTSLQSITANSALTISGGVGVVNNLIVGTSTANVNIQVPSVGTVLVNSAASGVQITIPTGTTVANLNSNTPITVAGTGNIMTANLGANTTMTIRPVTIGAINGVTVTVGGVSTPADKIITSVPKDLTPATETASSFQNDINSKYADYAVVNIVQQATSGFKVQFEKIIDNSKTGSDYVTQDVLVTNGDGTDDGITYNNGVYTAPSGSKVYAVVRVYRDGQIGYVTSEVKTVE
jgi:hypothetical protein